MMSEFFTLMVLVLLAGGFFWWLESAYSKWEDSVHDENKMSERFREGKRHE